VPSEHARRGALAPAQYDPNGHGTHTAGFVAVAAVVCTVPAVHAPSRTHVAWLTDDENVPAAHGAHWRSELAVPEVLTYKPGAHVLHAVQLVAFSVPLKLPVEHDAHARSAVAEGSDDT